MQYLIACVLDEMPERFRRGVSLLNVETESLFGRSRETHRLISNMYLTLAPRSVTCTAALCLPLAFKPLWATAEGGGRPGGGREGHGVNRDNAAGFTGRTMGLFSFLSLCILGFLPSPPVLAP